MTETNRLNRALTRRGGASPRRFAVILAVVSALGFAGRAQNLAPRQYTVELTAVTQAEPASVRITWPSDAEAAYYTIHRRTGFDEPWQQLAELDGEAVGFEDENVRSGAAFEYRVTKSHRRGFLAYGYLSAAIDLPLVERRGAALVLAPESIARSLEPELTRFQRDLIGDGWEVDLKTVSARQTPAGVKKIILGHAASRSDLEAVILVGNLPVPYSGNFAPDWHDDHKGAWPADGYYGDLDGEWTDETVDTQTAARLAQRNIPGDWKFDQSSFPSSIELQVGRIDLSDMTAFANKTPSLTEEDLLRRYFDKNHRFRQGELRVRNLGLIADNLGFKGDDPVSGSAWRNFSVFFGSQGISEVGWTNYFPAVEQGSYLWSFTAGGGYRTGSHGIGSADDLAARPVPVIFTMSIGSYFGDWDNESNFLRAQLGAEGGPLTSVYAGFPQWLFHPMAIGQTAGFCARLTQNNPPGGPYPPHNQGAGQAHIALMGDPTLRMRPVPPPSSIQRIVTAQGSALSWKESPDPEVIGYHVYRAPSKNETFARVTGPTPIDRLWFLDAENASPDAAYMVRAVKREQTLSGSYFNASQGAFAPSATPSVDGSESPTAESLDWAALRENGFLVAPDRNAIPEGWEIQVENAQSFVWKTSTEDPRAPELADGNRIAACWHSAQPWAISIRPPDNDPRRLAVYSLDWDALDREQTLSFVDADSGDTLASETVRGFGDGRLTIWSLSGPSRIEVTPVNGPNAVLSGLFILPPSNPERPPRAPMNGFGGADGLRIIGFEPVEAGLLLNAAGAQSSNVVLQTSEDLRHWTTVEPSLWQGTAPSLQTTILGPSSQRRFFRLYAPAPVSD